VIAQAYLNEWASQAPWPQQAQVEQDLVLPALTRSNTVAGA
jgi:hypothetical protein